MFRPLLISNIFVLLLLAGCTPPPPGPDVTVPTGGYFQDDFANLPGWQDDNIALAIPPFRASCQTLRFKEEWKAPCEALNLLPEEINPDQARGYFEEHFTPYRIVNSDGTDTGTITGYYAPLLNGSRIRSPGYPYPLYQRPDDMLTIDLGDQYPELKNLRLRGRLDGNRVIPYYSRAEIDGEGIPLFGSELLYVDDPVELFFLHIQGSGIIRLDTGEMLMVNYADQNGHPYRSLGKKLIADGEMTLAQASMQGIASWAKKNPYRMQEYLNHNPSYVFFRELPSTQVSPPGALGVPLTPERSIAIDRRTMPLGAPVFLDTTWPSSNRPLQRLMVAQDVGGAIKGGVRADFYWGIGDEAGAQAGKMKQSGRMWYLAPL